MTCKQQLQQSLNTAPMETRHSQIRYFKLISEAMLLNVHFQTVFKLFYVNRKVT